MANNCDYNMKVVGKTHEALEEFVSLLNYTHPKDKYFARIFEAYVYEDSMENDNYIMKISGDCAWSVYSCMCNGPFTYYEDSYNKDLTNLEKETKRLGLKVEIYSQEPGIGFAEHIIYDNGEEVLNEETDLSMYWYNEDIPIEEFAAEYGLELDEYELAQLEADGYITIGGFDEVFTI